MNEIIQRSREEWAEAADALEALAEAKAAKAKAKAADGSDAIDVSELAAGQALSKEQLPPKGLSTDHLRYYAGCLLLALEHLASLDVAHRDLHCDNLLVDSTGRLKLIDFGLAKV